jgi:hypothetical protein
LPLDEIYENLGTYLQGNPERELDLQHLGMLPRVSVCLAGCLALEFGRTAGFQ